MKQDAGKTRFDLLPWDAIEALARVVTHGAAKYGDRNWESDPLPWSRYFAAAHRHLAAWWGGEDLDPDSGLPHLAHAGCCLAFLSAYARRRAGRDDRPCAIGGIVHGVDLHARALLDALDAPPRVLPTDNPRRPFLWLPRGDGADFYVHVHPHDAALFRSVLRLQKEAPCRKRSVASSSNSTRSQTSTLRRTTRARSRTRRSRASASR